MDKSENWLMLVLVTLAFALGRSTARPGDLAWFVLPFFFSFVAAVWRRVAHGLHLTADGTEEVQLPIPMAQPIIINRDGTQTFLQDDSKCDRPFILDDCTTILICPKGGGNVRLSVRAVTMAEFVRRGWQVGFSASQMNGMILADGLRTKVNKNGNWRSWTDALARAKLIRKGAGEPTVALLPLNGLLEHVSPYPTPKGWHGWFK